MDELYKFDLCFCSSHRIFRACSSLIRNVFVCSRLNFCSFFNFCTSEPICFFHVYSVSAILLFPLCAALWVVCGLGPGNRCLQLYLLLLGAEPKGLEPLLLLYVLLLLLLLLLLLYSSNGSLWQPYEGNMGK